MSHFSDQELDVIWQDGCRVGSTTLPVCQQDVVVGGVGVYPLGPHGPQLIDDLTSGLFAYDKKGWK